jgi:hypothetical protein
MDIAASNAPEHYQNVERFVKCIIAIFVPPADFSLAALRPRNLAFADGAAAGAPVGHAAPAGSRSDDLSPAAPLVPFRSASVSAAARAHRPFPPRFMLDERLTQLDRP